MDIIKDLIKKNPFLALVLPTTLSGFSFGGALLTSLSDSKIDAIELHDLLASANGFETLLLIIIMLSLKGNNKKKS